MIENLMLEFKFFKIVTRKHTFSTENLVALPKS